MQSQEQTELSFLNAEAVLQVRHRHAEVLAHEIESRIADDRSQQHALLPVAIFPGDGGWIVRFNRNGSGGRKDFEQTSEGRGLSDNCVVDLVGHGLLCLWKRREFIVRV